MPGVKQVTDTQSDWASGTLSGVEATAAGDVELISQQALVDNFDDNSLNPKWQVFKHASATISEVNGRIEITADGNYHASIERPIAPMENPVAVVRVNPASGDTGSNWGPALGFRWPNGKHIRVYPNKGQGKFTLYADGYGETFNIPFSTGSWYWMRLRLDATTIYAEISTDGTTWQLVASKPRTADFSGPPDMIGLGKHPFTHDDYTASGSVGTSYFDDLSGPLFLTGGQRVSPILDLSPVGTAASSSISWAATTPAGTSVTVETRLSLDGGATWEPWQTCTNGGPIPGISAGTDLSNARLQTRQTLSTTDTTATPQLHSLTVAVPVAGSASAPMLVQVGVSRSIAPPVPVSVGLAKAVSCPVLVQAGLAKATARELRVYVVAVSRRIPASRRIRARLNIGRPDGATWEDVTDYLASARISLGDVRALGTGNEGVDERVRTATFTLRQDRVPGGPSLSPRDRTSPWNQWGGQYAPLIWPRRQVLFEAKVVADSPSQYLTQAWAEPVGFGDGATRAFQLDRWPVEPGSEVVYVNGEAQRRDVDYTIDCPTGQVTFAAAPPAGLPITADYTYWLPVFEGLMDDWRTDGPTVEFNCRDLAATLQDTYIEVTRTYGSPEGTPLEQVIQQILDDNLGAGVVQLYCLRSPGFAVRPYNVEYQSVWDAIQSAVIKTVGWFLGFWLDPITNRFRLTLLEPPRNKGPEDADWELDYRDDIYVNDLGGSIADVRNVVRVTFRNAATGKRETITVEDPASIAEYGRRAMQIEEADASLIDTPEEAMALAVAAVADLKDQHATANLELPFLPMLNVMDGVVVRDDRVSSEPDFFAVESVEHTLDFDGGRFRTTAVCSGRVVGAHTRWMEMQTRPGAQQPTRMVAADAVEVTQAQPPIPQTVEAYSIPMGVVVLVPAPIMRNWRLTRVRLLDSQGNVVATYEARASRFEFTGLSVGATYYADAQYEDTEGGTGPWSARVSAVASGNISALAIAAQSVNASGAVSGGVLQATEYIRLPVRSSDPANPPDGAMWMRA